MSRDPAPTAAPHERVIICGVIFPDFPEETGGYLQELRALVAASGGEVVGTGVTQKRDRPVPATLMGSGKVEEIKEEVDLHEPSAVVVDNDLSPAQVRNLEKMLSCRVVDRSELILDIFAERAQTRQACLQVELAQLEYLAPRLRRMWTHLERTEGAIGTRGPGETQLETDRRLLRKRVRDLKRELDVIEGRKRREVASRITGFTVGLVGYTNAGKSTLLNKLTGATEFVADMPFATLDTRTRRWTLPDGRLALLSDTVGFLQRLPHHLVASFHATLEETLAADLLVHVVDASHPDAPQQMVAVVKVLDDLSHHVPSQALVLNKIDEGQDPIALHLLSDGFEGEVVFLSAKTGQGLDRLAEVVAQHLDTRSEFLILRLPASDGKSLAYLRGHGAVLEEEWIEESEQYQLRVRLDAAATATLARDGDSKLRVSRDEGETFEELVPKPPRPEWA